MGLISELTLRYEELCNAICNDYCKYGSEIKGKDITDAELEEFGKKYCDNCPLLRL